MPELSGSNREKLLSVIQNSKLRSIADELYRPTVIIEDVFCPKIIELLSENENAKLLYSIFKYFEEVSNCEEEHLINIFTITVLEVLGNDRAILKTAQEYMGPKTKKLQVKADRGLGRY